MNQFYRATHMPLNRLVRKLCGEKEIYTIAVRRREHQLGTEPLPALGGKPYTPFPYIPGYWFADPMLYTYGGMRWLFAERMNRATGKGDIVAWVLDENLRPGTMVPVLEEPYHLSFPNVFDWNGEIWMIPETGANRTLNLYRCTEFPHRWERVRIFDVGCSLADTILWEKSTDVLKLLCSEVNPENGLEVRYRRYFLRRLGENLVLEEDEAFNMQHKDYDLTSRNAGPMFLQDGMPVHPTQISTEVDYGVYLQFLALQGNNEAPMCAATPNNVQIEGIDQKDYIGIHTYCRDEDVEVIDLRYLAKVEKVQNVPSVPPQTTPAAPKKVEVAPEEELQQELERAQIGRSPEGQEELPELREMPEDLPELPSLEELQRTLQERLLSAEQEIESTAEMIQAVQKPVPEPEPASESEESDPPEVLMELSSLNDEPTAPSRGERWANKPTETQPQQEETRMAETPQPETESVPLASPSGGGSAEGGGEGSESGRGGTE